MPERHDQKGPERPPQWTRRAFDPEWGRDVEARVGERTRAGLVPESVVAATGLPVTPEYQAPFPFTGGTIDKVVVDLSGERYLDHEAQVRTWFAID